MAIIDFLVALVAARRPAWLFGVLTAYLLEQLTVNGVEPMTAVLAVALVAAWRESCLRLSMGR